MKLLFSALFETSEHTDGRLMRLSRRRDHHLDFYGIAQKLIPRAGWQRRDADHQFSLLLKLGVPPGNNNVPPTYVLTKTQLRRKTLDLAKTWG